MTPLKVLIVDDDVTSRLMLQAMLVEWNYDVVSVADGNGWMATDMRGWEGENSLLHHEWVNQRH
jgi:CheY-like chemotaxis protein